MPEHCKEMMGQSGDSGEVSEPVAV
jgi:hypothetical protein